MKGGELRRVVEAVVETLGELGIEYHVTGGLASSFYGEPRLTQEVGMLLDPAPVDRQLLHDLAGDLGCVDLLKEIRSKLGE